MTEQKIDQAQLQAVMAQHQNMANAQVGTVVREAMAAAFRYGVEARDMNAATAHAEANAKQTSELVQGVMRDRDALQARVLELEKATKAKKKK